MSGTIMIAGGPSFTPADARAAAAGALGETQDLAGRGVARRVVAMPGASADLVAAFGAVPVLAPDGLAGARLVVAGDGDPSRIAALWARDGLGDALRRAFAGGAAVYAEAGAGVACMESGVWGAPPSPHAGVGLLPLSVCPNHQDPSTQGVYYGLISRMVAPRGFGVDDGCAVVIGGGPPRAVGVRPGAHAYTLEHVAGEVILKVVAG